MRRKLSLSEAEEMARIATRKELEKYEIPSQLFEKIVLTTLFEEDDRVFVLYMPGETRHDPTVVARTRINLNTGHIHVEVPATSGATRRSGT
jgi:hypothetical protein